MTSIRLYPSAPLLSRLVLGGSTFGRENDQATCFTLMDAALERGITLIDTAAAYSAGASESIVGAWLSARQPEPSRLSVATKIYPPYTAAQIDLAVTASAARLGVGAIDVLYLHKWDATAETDEALRALDRLIQSGRVRALGLSNFTAEQLQAILDRQTQLQLTPFRILQNNNNLAVRDVDDRLRQICSAHGIALVTYSPLGAGFLTGKHRHGVAPGSRFDVAPGHQPIYFQPAAERRLDHLEAVSVRTGLSQQHLALAWAIHHPGVAAVLIGGRTIAHVDQAFAALALDDPALMAELGSV
jgi:aryl-alcohol dehydrogenase-like predicted oxidoreductase